MLNKPTNRLKMYLITYWNLCILFGTLCFSIVAEFCSAVEGPFGLKVLFQIHLLLSFPSD